MAFKVVLLPAGIATGQHIPPHPLSLRQKLKCVASGAQLYMWAYGKDPEDGGAPVSVLKTRRSLRCVQFSPCGAPYILTAEASLPQPLLCV